MARLAAGLPEANLSDWSAEPILGTSTEAHTWRVAGTLLDRSRARPFSVILKSRLGGGFEGATKQLLEPATQPGIGGLLLSVTVVGDESAGGSVRVGTVEAAQVVGGETVALDWPARA